MPLTQEQRVELLAKARAAKANKKLAESAVVNVEPPVEQPETPKVKKSRKKQEVIPEPVQPIPESDESEPEVVAAPAPAPAPKKKGLPVKWLKAAPEPQKCCDEKVSKEKPLIDDEPQVIEQVVVPSKKELKKPRAPRTSTRTLEIVAEPKAIEDVLDDVKNNDMKYRPPQKRHASVPPTAPIQIIKAPPSLNLFDY